MQNKHILYGAFVALLLTFIFSTSDNLSELAPVFLVLSVLGFGCYLYRRTWGNTHPDSIADRATPLTKISAILGMGGIGAIGVGLCGLFVPGLETLPPVALFGLGGLVFALIARIASGMRAKRVDTTTGALSILAILGLSLAIGLGCLALYLLYLLLTGLGLG